jgi:hypothetical protein
VRSQQVYQALTHVPNRFALCRITCIALRKLHRTQARPEDTISDVLTDINRYRSRRTFAPPLPGNIPGATAFVPSQALHEATNHGTPEKGPDIQDLALAGD